MVEKAEVVQETTLLRSMLAKAIECEGEWHSFMIRAGLLADLLDEIARHRLANSPGLTSEYLRGVEDAAKVADSAVICVPLGVGLADGASMAARSIATAIRALGQKP